MNLPNSRYPTQFGGHFPEGEKIEVDAEAFRKILNALLSSQTHHILEHMATRNLPDSEIRTLQINMEVHLIKHVLKNGLNSDGDAQALANLVAQTKERVEKDADEAYAKNRIQIASMLDIAETYPKSFPSGFSEGEIVKRKDGKPFFLGETKYVEDAVLVRSQPEHNLLFLGTTTDFSTTWSAPTELLNEVESTGIFLDAESMQHLLIAYEVLVGKE